MTFIHSWMKGEGSEQEILASSVGDMSRGGPCAPGQRGM